MSDAVRARVPTSLAVVVALGLAGCPGPPLEPSSELDPRGTLGRFLQGSLPDPRPEGAGPRRILRPLDRPPALEHRTLAIDLPGTAGSVVWATVPGVPLRDGTTFRYPCGSLRDARLRWWLHARGPEPIELAIRIGDRTLDVRVPPPANQLLSYEAPLGEPPCSGERLAVELRVRSGSDASTVGEPILTVADPAGAGGPHVVLVSIDTQRLDRWEDPGDEGPHLRSLREDAVRFLRAYASYPATAVSHSVLFSGRDPDRIVREPGISVVEDLRRAGYVTLGFVPGGQVRSLFGFGRGAGPGFAAGFDLYLEHQPLPGVRTNEEVREVRRERDSHTLGRSMERSIRSFARDPGLPAFHFVHGYDVHEYQEVATLYWERTLAAAGPDDPRVRALERCRGSLELVRRGDLVTHGAALRGARQPRGNDACFEPLISLLYEARVRSAKDLLDRYLGALRTLGIYDRALIVVTSDHGESLLDEVGPFEPGLRWGHGRPTPGTLRVPLWIKPPGRRGGSATVEEIAGLVDVRRTIEAAVGLPPAPGPGRDLLADALAPHPIRFASRRWERGVVLGPDRLCAIGPDGRIAVHDGRAWRSAAPAELDRCRTETGDPAPTAEPAYPVDPAVRRELRALGYAE